MFRPLVLTCLLGDISVKSYQEQHHYTSSPCLHLVVLRHQAGAIMPGSIATPTPYHLGSVSEPCDLTHRRPSLSGKGGLQSQRRPISVCFVETSLCETERHRVITSGGYSLSMILSYPHIHRVTGCVFNLLNFITASSVVQLDVSDPYP